MFIDLSLPIDERAPEVHPFGIERLGHKEEIRHLNWTMMKKIYWEKSHFF